MFHLLISHSVFLTIQHRSHSLRNLLAPSSDSQSLGVWQLPSSFFLQFDSGESYLITGELLLLLQLTQPHHKCLVVMVDACVVLEEFLVVVDEVHMVLVEARVVLTELGDRRPPQPHRSLNLFLKVGDCFLRL